MSLQVEHLRYYALRGSEILEAASWWERTAASYGFTEEQGYDSGAATAEAAGESTGDGVDAQEF